MLVSGCNLYFFLIQINANSPAVSVFQQVGTLRGPLFSAVLLDKLLAATANTSAL